MPDGSVPITQVYREETIFSAMPMFHVSPIRTVYPIQSFLGFELRLRRAHSKLRVPLHCYHVATQGFQNFVR